MGDATPLLGEHLPVVLLKHNMVSTEVALCLPGKTPSLLKQTSLCVQVLLQEFLLEALYLHGKQAVWILATQASKTLTL